MDLQKRCGCLPPIEDKRDWQFTDTVACASFKTLPREYKSSLADILPVMDQYDSQMCTAFAGATFKYLIEYTDSNNRLLFSPAYLYSCRDDDEYQGDGDYLRNVLNRLVKKGVCFLDSFNCIGTYQEVRKQYCKNIDAYDTEAYPFRNSGYYKVTTINDIKKAIMSGGAVFVSYAVFNNWNVSSDGIIKMPYGNSYGYHCVLLVGWKQINGEEYFIVHNSWGTGWGNNGRGYIPVKYPFVESYVMLDDVHEVKFSTVEFSDIDTHWAKDYIERLANHGYVNGYKLNDATYIFDPDKSITRAELCAILSKCLDLTTISTNTFYDVQMDSWYYTYVQKCVAAKIVNGIGDNLFDPNGLVTREQAATMLFRAYNIPSLGDTYFVDSEEVSDWAKTAVATLGEMKIIEGYDTGMFRPKSNVTRAEICKMICAIIDYT